MVSLTKRASFLRYCINDRKDLSSKKYVMELIASHKKKCIIATLRALLFPKIVFKKKTRPSYYNIPAPVTISNSHTLEIGIRRRYITREQFPAIFHSILDEWCDSYHLDKTRHYKSNPSSSAHIVCLFVPVYRKILPRAN